MTLFIRLGKLIFTSSLPEFSLGMHVGFIKCCFCVEWENRISLFLRLMSWRITFIDFQMLNIYLAFLTQTPLVNILLIYFRFNLLKLCLEFLHLSSYRIWVYSIFFIIVMSLGNFGFQNELRSIPSPLILWKNLWVMFLFSSSVFPMIHHWRHLSLKFLCLKVLKLQIQYHK